MNRAISTRLLAIQIKAVATFLIIFRASMNILVKNQVKILMQVVYLTD